jgi:Na+/H+ antiporter NhaD/arsenite permease-like protein
LGIIFENKTRLTKQGLSLVAGLISWLIYAIMNENKQEVILKIQDKFDEIGSLLLFILFSLIVVQIIIKHGGFDIIIENIKTTSKRKLMWIFCWLTFFLSAIFDSLSVTIIIITVLQIFIPKRQDRLIYLGMVVIAANAGGAWSPIGSLSTTLFWNAERITALYTILNVFVPSVFCLLIPLFIVSFKIKGNIEKINNYSNYEIHTLTNFEKKLLLIIGILSLIIFLVFSDILHLPPFFGMLFTLITLWISTTIMHRKKSDEIKVNYSVFNIAKDININGMLFMIGIIITVSALRASGILRDISDFTLHTLKDFRLIAISTGILSSVVDNVTLAASAVKIYDFNVITQNHDLWRWLTYTIPTGGSIFIIGSVSGLAIMSFEHVTFKWYLNKISWLAIIGFFSGIAIFYLRFWFNNSIPIFEICFK